MSCSAQNATPRWSVLLGLGLAVLLMHVLLLGGGGGLSDLFGSSDSGEQAAPADVPTVAANMAPDQPANARPLPVGSSTVRFVPPKPPPPPAPVKKPRPVAPKPAPEPVPSPVEPAMPVEALEPAIEPEAEPVAEPAAEPAAPEPMAPAPLTAEPAPGTQAPAAPPVPAGVELPQLGYSLVPSTELAYEATGQAKGFKYTASGSLKWTHDGQGYEAVAEVSAFLLGSRSQRSSGRITAQGLAPDRFVDRSRSERAAHFDRETQRVRYSNNAPDAPLLPGTQDQVSVSLQLGLMFNGRPEAYPAGTVLRLPVSNVSVTEIWEFEVGPEEDLALPAGNIVVRKLLRKPRREFDRSVEIWLAPGLRHLPVRLRITQTNGDFVDQQLKRLPELPPPSGPPT